MHVGGVHNNKPMGRSHVSDNEAMVLVITEEGDYAELLYIAPNTSATSIMFVQGS